MKTMPAFQFALKNQEIRNFKGIRDKGVRVGNEGRIPLCLCLVGLSGEKCFSLGSLREAWPRIRPPYFPLPRLELLVGIPPSRMGFFIMDNNHTDTKTYGSASFLSVYQLQLSRKSSHFALCNFSALLKNLGQMVSSPLVLRTQGAGKLVFSLAILCFNH